MILCCFLIFLVDEGIEKGRSNFLSRVDVNLRDTENKEYKDCS